MERQDFIMFFFGVLTLFFGLIIQPYVSMVVMRLKRLFTRKKHTITTDMIANLSDDVEYLQEQIDELTELVSKREKNRRSNVRRDVREYLEELKNGK